MPSPRVFAGPVAGSCIALHRGRFVRCGRSRFDIHRNRHPGRGGFCVHSTGRKVGRDHASGLPRLPAGLIGRQAGGNSHGRLMDAVDRVVWSRDGNFAVFYSAVHRRFQRVRFSASEAMVDAPVDLAGNGPVTALAIDPAGRQIAIGVAGAGLFLADAGQAPVLLSSMTQPAAVGFRRWRAPVRGRSGRGAYCGIRRRIGAPWNSPCWWSRMARRLKPAGLAVSSGGRYLMMIDRAAQAVSVYETGRTAWPTRCRSVAPPSRVEPLSAATFLFNGDESNGWLLILDATEDPTVYFVPASPGGASMIKGYRFSWRLLPLSVRR